MFCADRLMIGTANFGKKYRGYQVPEDEVKKILDYCQCSGIKWLDTARAYECDDVIDRCVNSYFNIQYKVLDDDPVPDWVTQTISHDEVHRGIGTTHYEPNHDSYAGTWNIPYSIVDRRWEENIRESGMDWQARSVFCGGKVFNSCHSTFSRIRLMARTHKMSPGSLCILFCLLNPNIDKVVIGVNSVHELKDDLRLFHRLDQFQIDDVNIIDLRKNHVKRNEENSKED